MRWLHVLRRDTLDRELDKELQFHLDQRVEDYVTQGLSREEAHRRARAEFGGMQQIREQCWDVRRLRWLDDLSQDVRLAERALRRQPLFALTAALSLAIGIGSNTAIFTVANGLLFRAPLGVAEAGRLVDVTRTESGSSFANPTSPYSTYLEVRQRATTLDGVYACQLELAPMSLSGPGGAERVFASVVTLNYFSVLGVRSAAGRLFGAGDSEESGASPIAVLSHGFWTRRFSADPAIVGHTVRLNGHPFTVVGVAGEGSEGRASSRRIFGCRHRWRRSSHGRWISQGSSSAGA